MRIRDALESDAEALATATGRPREVVRNMIHDRSVRVAVEDDGDEEKVDGDEETVGHGEENTGGDEERDGRGEESKRANAESDSGGGTVRGFVAFDVRADTVHVTDFEGNGTTVKELFEEPRRFARREGMGVEVVVPNDEETSEVIEASGFTAAGRGPRFDGRRTTRYRIESDELDGG